jgi:hypothetical protein
MWGFFMKIFSTASAAALLLGISVLMASATVQATAPCGAAVCATWWAECGQGNQQACSDYKAICSACPPPSTVSGTPPVKINSESDAALLNPKQAILAAK